MRYLVMISALLVSGTARAASPASYAPTSFEIFYQPTYSMAYGGSDSPLSALGGGIRIGYGMTPLFAFELGAYYDGYAFAGTGQSAYAARVTGDFALVPTPSIRIYAGMDANAFFNPPSGFTSTGQKDLGAIGGVRFLFGGAVRMLAGLEYRYAANTPFTYAGTSVDSSSVLGTIGLHFGGM